MPEEAAHSPRRNFTFGDEHDRVNPIVKIAIPRASGCKQRFVPHAIKTIHEAIHEAAEIIFPPLRQIS